MKVSPSYANRSASVWYWDSGCKDHICIDRSILHDVEENHCGGPYFCSLQQGAVQFISPFATFGHPFARGLWSRPVVFQALDLPRLLDENVAYYCNASAIPGEFNILPQNSLEVGACGTVICAITAVLRKF